MSDFHAQQLARFLAMTDTQAKRSIRAAVAERVIQRVCLCCERKEHTRGLCLSHFRQFQTERDALPAEQRVAFEEDAIREGKILPVGQARKIRRKSVFQPGTRNSMVG